MPTSIPYDEAREIIKQSLDDMRASGKFKCEYDKVDSRIDCPNLGPTLSFLEVRNCEYALYA